MTRKIKSPGIELNEIDRSQYGLENINSQDGTVSLIAGFADKGEDYVVKYINSMNAFENEYGKPKSEAEKYLYNAASEVIESGGIAAVAKLPYKNTSFNNCSYMTYSVDTTIHDISTVLDMVEYRPNNNRNMIELFQSYYTNNDIPCCDQVVSSLLYRMDSNFYRLFNKYYQLNKDIVGFYLSSIEVTNQERYVTSVLFDYSRPTSILRMNEIFLSNYTDLSSFLSGIPYGMSVCVECLDSLHDKSIQQFNTPLKMFQTYFKEQTQDVILYYYEQIIDFSESINDMVSYNYLTSNVPIEYIDRIQQLKYCPVRKHGYNIKKYVNISANISNDTSIIDIDIIDSYLIGKNKVKPNEIMIIDKTRSKYQKDDEENEIIGLLPVITTPINAMYYQGIIENSIDIISDYNVIEFFQNETPFSEKCKQLTNINYNSKNITGLTLKLGNEEPISLGEQSLSRSAAKLFPYINTTKVEVSRRYLKSIGVVLFKMYRDKSDGNKIGFSAVESFCGTLNRNDIDVDTGDNTFIDNIVNNNSNYIYLFSNVDKEIVDNVDTYAIKNQNSTCLGFYESLTEKIIDCDASIIQPLQRILDSVVDFNVLDMDQIVDAGVSNIAQFIKSTQNGIGYYDINSEFDRKYKLENKEDVEMWKNVINLVSQFVKCDRQDCYYLVDGPRNLCLDGNYKIIRDTKLTNTFRKTIYPKLKLISGLINSSYAAGYLDWFKSIDKYSGQYLWIPPSIKVSGVCSRIDRTGKFWEAPAGINRATLANVVDLAFNPSQEDSDDIYEDSWNYAKYMPLYGITIEGQRTFQSDKTALDRLNVRKLMNGLKKAVRAYTRNFTYEQNTQYTRATIRDNLNNYFENIRTRGGLNRYLVVCDDTNNTYNTIDNNELHISIYVQPIKVIEFISLTFVCTNQSFNVDETIQ